MGRAPCCAKVGLHRGAWSDEEDKLLANYIQTHGEGQWRSMPSKAGLLRCGKSCRLRWMNYLRPGIKRGNFTAEENDTIIRLHSIHGSRWSLIATELSGRTDNEIKNHWNSHLKQKVVDANDDKKANIQKEKKKRKTDHKSKKTKTVEKPIEIVPDQPISTTTSSLPSSQSDSTSLDNGSMSGASSSSTIDQVDTDLLMTDFSWPNWSPLFDIDGALSINSQHDISSLDMPFDGLDLLMMKHDESEMLEKLYDECLQLIEDGDGHE